MARQLRIEYPGATYHVTSRGNERGIVYLDDADRKHFVQLIKECSSFYLVEIVGYCLMPNHFHLLLSTRQANLSRFMQSLNTAYTQYFNLRHKRCGHLFQGRYKAIIVGSEDYLLRLSRYIHLNPVKTKACAAKTKDEKCAILNDYKWSSLHETLEPSMRSPYLKCGKVLEAAGGDTAKGLRRYKQYVLEGLGDGQKNPMDDVKFQTVLGADNFVEWIKEQFVKGKDTNDYPHLRATEGAKDVNEIALHVSKKFGVKAGEILGIRSAHREARRVLIELVYRANLRTKSLKEIGRDLGGISGSAVAQTHKRVKAQMLSEEKFNDNIKAMSKYLSIVEV